MATFLAILLAVLCLFYIWLSGHTLKREKRRRKQLRERMDEFDRCMEEQVKEMARLQSRYDEARSQLAATRAIIRQKESEIKHLIDELHEQPCTPADDPVQTPTNPATPDFQELKESFGKLSTAFNALNRQYENPSKRYIVSNLVRLYDVKNLGALAKALGVKTSSLSQKLKK